MVRGGTWLLQQFTCAGKALGRIVLTSILSSDVKVFFYPQNAFVIMTYNLVIQDPYARSSLKGVLKHPV